MILEEGGIKDLEESLVLYCSPTLAGIKPGNLFSYAFRSITGLVSEIQKTNRLLNRYNIHAQVLKLCNNTALILVYREKQLAENLCKKEVVDFLNHYGYLEVSVPRCIDQLKQRLLISEEFPHEIGLFLGYPLADVIGFIHNRGRNCICTGCWKVYCDEHTAKTLFKRYQKCTCIYKKHFYSGKKLAQLLVAA